MSTEGCVCPLSSRRLGRRQSMCQSTLTISRRGSRWRITASIACCSSAAGTESKSASKLAPACKESGK
jgi:hypothetical protein